MSKRKITCNIVIIRALFLKFPNKMSVPEPIAKEIEVDGFLLKYKGYLKKILCFSYRCKNFHIMKCRFLLSIPINTTNSDEEKKAQNLFTNLHFSTQT